MVDFNWLMLLFLFFYIAQTAFRIWVERINIIHSEKYSDRVPLGFEDFIDGAKLKKISAYTRETSRIGILREVAENTVLLAILLSGFLPMLVSLFERGHLSLIPAGLLFFFIPGAIQFLVEIPFGYYNTFVIEEKFGFNKSTLRLWILDLVKAGLVEIVLFSLLFSALLLIISDFPRFWWFWGFLVVITVQLIMAVLYPVLIAPLFNRFEAVKDEELARKITILMADNGIRVKRILQMDAGLRSSHTNAYFTGFGKTKQIVLYDTLLESHTHDEILSVLAHEAGHFRKKHILKQFIIFACFSLVAFYVTYLFIQWPLLYETFGFAAPIPYVGLFLAGVFGQKAAFFLQPLYMEVSRRFEREADLFSLNMLKTPKPMLEALKRLAADNLSNLNPHPVYVWFHYSHPPIVERVAELEEAGNSFGDTQSAYLEKSGR